MIKKIGKKLESVIESYGSEDALLYKGSEIVVSLDSFRSLESIDVENDDSKLVYFVDGGQAQILNGGSFMLSFIRVAAVGYKGEVKVDIRKNEFYVLTYLVERQGRKYFESKIFPMEGSERLILEDL